MKPTADELSKWFSMEYPPSELPEADLAAMVGKLNELIPRDTMMTDLWDWDVHFETDWDSDWYFEAVFGAASTLDTCAEELADYFHEQVDECEMDYDQQRDPEAFITHVRSEARKLLAGWRANIYKAACGM